MTYKVTYDPSQLSLFANVSSLAPEIDAEIEPLQSRITPSPNPLRDAPEKCLGQDSGDLASVDRPDSISRLSSEASAELQPSAAGRTELTPKLGLGGPVGFAKRTANTRPGGGRWILQNSQTVLPVVSGEEPMQARALELYSAYADLVGMSPLELRRAGSEISVDHVSTNSLKAQYLACDSSFQRVLRGEGAEAQVDFGTERRLAEAGAAPRSRRPRVLAHCALPSRRPSKPCGRMVSTTTSAA